MWVGCSSGVGRRERARAACGEEEEREGRAGGREGERWVWLGRWRGMERSNEGMRFGVRSEEEKNSEDARARSAVSARRWVGIELAMGFCRGAGVGDGGCEECVSDCQVSRPINLSRA